ncbi:DDE-domain-containing protein, partial [Ramaria rubella]
GTKTQHKQGGGDWENVTALITICTDGTALQPPIIFKGKNFMKKWADSNVSGALICHSPNGWIDSELAVQWMENDFDAQTKAKMNGLTQVLLMDGHSSHYTPRLLRHAKDNNIVILGYPPHCTHALQGLDVVCFAQMKDIYWQEVHTFEDVHGHKMAKADFTGVFRHAFLHVFTPETIKSAFKATGIYPFDPSVISPAQMKPSEPSSIKGVFPLPQPSPVRGVIATFHHQPPTSFDISPDTHTRSSSPTLERDPNIDPSLYTPSKHICLMNAAIAGTASGSYLVSKTPIYSSQTLSAPVLETPLTLPQPDWSL